MKLDNTFAVKAPIDEVWAAVMNVERVAGCVPGAKVLGRLSDDAYQVGMKVKLGPVSMQYRGQLEILERDAEAHRAVLHGKAKESRGQGTADATVELKLVEEGDRTLGTVHADVRLSGRAAAMGQGIVGSVADQMAAQFAENLQTMLSEPEGAPDADPADPTEAAEAASVVDADAALDPDRAAAPADAVEAMGAPADASRSGDTVADGVDRTAEGSHWKGVIAPPEDMRPGTSPVEQVRGDGPMTEGQVVDGPGEGPAARLDVPQGTMPEATVSAAAQTSVGARVSDRISASGGQHSAGHEDEDDDGGGLDALALARGVAGAQLKRPGVLAGVVVAVALVAYGLGRRSSRSRGHHGVSVEDFSRLIDLVDRRRG